MILIAALAVIFVIRRQLATRRVDLRRMFAAPALLLVYGGVMTGLQSGGDPFDGAGPALVAALVVAELVVALGLGVVRARTMTVWRTADGTVLRRGNARTLAAWAASVAARLALAALAAAVGMHTATGAYMVFFAITLAAQNGMVLRRAAALPRVRGAARDDELRV